MLEIVVEVMVVKVMKLIVVVEVVVEIDVAILSFKGWVINMFTMETPKIFSYPLKNSCSFYINWEFPEYKNFTILVIN